MYLYASAWGRGSAIALLLVSFCIVMFVVPACLCCLCRRQDHANVFFRGWKQEVWWQLKEAYST